MKTKSVCFVIFFISLFLFQLHAQSLSSINITVNDGLPSNTIRAIYKDSRGLLWIGTDNGLCSYDGIKFKVYDEISKQKNNAIWAIVEGLQHNIWFSAYGNGLVKFDGKKFTCYDNKNGLINNSIRKLYFSKKHQCLIIGTENGLSVFTGSKFKSFPSFHQKTPLQVLGINEWNDKVLITTRYNGVYALTFSSKNNEAYRLDSFFKTEICFSGFVNQNIYFGGTGEHHFFTKDLVGGNEKKFASPIIWDFAKAENNGVYAACWDVVTVSGGLFKYSNGQFQDISKQANINSTSLWSLFYDKENQILWVGSLDKGLYKLILKNQIESFDSKYFGLDKIEIKSLFNDSENNLWIGADNLIIKLNPNNKFEKIDKTILAQKIASYLTQQSKSISKFLPKGKLDNGFTTFNFVEDNHKNIWVATSWGILCFDEKLNLKNLKDSDGSHIAIDENQKLYWGEMYHGLSIFENLFSDKSIKDLAVENINTPTDINRVLIDRNRIWFGTVSKGLFVSDNMNFRHLNFSENHIADLAIDVNQNLLIGTNNGKVFLGKLQADSFQIIKQYLPEKQIIGTAISFVNVLNNMYLVGTNKGINVLKNDSLIALLNQSEGLPTLPYLCSEKDKTGNVFIANENGLYKFKANNFIYSAIQQKTEIGIKGIKINGQNLSDSLFSWDNYTGNIIQLNYQQNDVEINFSQNNILNADKNIYRYKIIGLSDTWSEYESNGKIHLRAIPNGKYQIILEGKNIGIGEVFATKKIELIITPPFWKTVWFITLSLILVLATIVIILRLRINAIKKREHEKAELTNKLLESRLIALRAQMNPHFTFNAINSIQNFIIDKDTHQALHYLSEFSKLIRQTLDNSAEKLIPLETEIDFLNSYIAVQKIRFESIQTVVAVDDLIDKYSLFIPTLIIQPFIENAFEHAFDNIITSKKIEVKFTQQNETLICKVEDNGKGFSENDSHLLHESKGIKLSKDRILLLNREYNSDKFTLKITSSNKGTVVVLTFPILLNAD